MREHRYFEEGYDQYHLKQGRDSDGWHSVSCYGSNGDSCKYQNLGVFIPNTEWEQITLEQIKEAATKQIQLKAQLAARPRKFGEPNY